MEDGVMHKIYELGYHLTPDIEEGEVRSAADQLSTIITSAGGTIVSNREPKRAHLSYPIKHKQYAYFGTVDFKTDPGAIDKINGELKLFGSLIRYILLRKPDEGEEIRTLGEHRARARVKLTHEAASTEGTTKPAKEKTGEEEQQMEQELEKVLEGI